MLLPGSSRIETLNVKMKYSATYEELSLQIFTNQLFANVHVFMYVFLYVNYADSVSNTVKDMKNYKMYEVKCHTDSSPFYYPHYYIMSPRLS